MPRDALNTFGKLLIESLRDRAIEHYEGLAHSHWKAPSLMLLQEELQSLTEEERATVRKCLVSAIDAGIHDFLFRLQEIGEYDNSIQVIVEGENIIQLSDGLHGELFAKNGWIAKYSKYKP